MVETGEGRIPIGGSKTVKQDALPVGVIESAQQLAIERPATGFQICVQRSCPRGSFPTKIRYLIAASAYCAISM